MKYTFDFSDKVLIWDFDKDEKRADKLIPNNLYIVKDGSVIWNMSDTVQREDVCTAVDPISDDMFYFCTFSGIGYTMHISDEIKCTQKKFVK